MGWQNLKPISLLNDRINLVDATICGIKSTENGGARKKKKKKHLKSVLYYRMPFPKYERTLFLNTWDRSKTSDSLIFLFLLSNWQVLLFLLFNLLVTSMVRPAISLLFVNTRKTVTEYNEWDASLLRSIRTSRNSKALNNKMYVTRLSHSKKE